MVSRPGLGYAGGTSPPGRPHAELAARAVDDALTYSRRSASAGRPRLSPSSKARPSASSWASLPEAASTPTREWWRGTSARHVPGNPTFIVENMTGAGSLIAANHIFRVRQAGRPHRGQVQRRADARAGPGTARGRVRRPRKFEFIGRRGQGGRRLRDDQGERDHERREVDGLSRARQAGRDRPGSVAGQHGAHPEGGARAPDPAGRRLQGARAEIRLAADGGEVAGGCWSWESMRATWRSGLECRRRRPGAAGDRAAASRICRTFRWRSTWPSPTRRAG